MQAFSIKSTFYLSLFCNDAYVSKTVKEWASDGISSAEPESYKWQQLYPEHVYDCSRLKVETRTPPPIYTVLQFFNLIQFLRSRPLF